LGYLTALFLNIAWLIKASVMALVSDINEFADHHIAFQEVKYPPPPPKKVKYPPPPPKVHLHL
jgi:hypothetical protein